MSFTIAGRAVAALAFLTAGGAANAADLPASVAPAVVPEVWNPWMLRVRALVVQPDASASLNTAAGRIPGASIDVSTQVVPELDITYFFTPNLAAELILGVTRHKIEGAGALRGEHVGNTWLLPPTLTVQYHFTDFGAFKPYIGVGVNYTTYFDSKARGQFTHMKLGDSWGVALQAGADFMIDEHWGVNIDVKKIISMEPTVSLNHRAVYGRAKLDPWLIGTGITYKF